MAPTSWHSWQIDRRMPISQDVLGLYDRIIATQPDVTRKGATMPYTSLNGQTLQFLTPDGHLAAPTASARAPSIRGQLPDTPM